jgi:2-keto-4-pentenoate hydratase
MTRRRSSSQGAGTLSWLAQRVRRFGAPLLAGQAILSGARFDPNAADTEKTS